MNSRNSQSVPTPRTAAEADSRWARLSASVRERHAERVAMATLRRELAAYNTPSAIADLMAAAERQPGRDAALVREILSDNLAHHGNRARHISAY